MHDLDQNILSTNQFTHLNQLHAVGLNTAVGDKVAITINLCLLCSSANGKTARTKKRMRVCLLNKITLVNSE